MKVHSRKIRVRELSRSTYQGQAQAGSVLFSRFRNQKQSSNGSLLLIMPDSY